MADQTHDDAAKARFAVLRSEAAGGLLLMGAALFAMIAANLPARICIMTCCTGRSARRCRIGWGR